MVISRRARWVLGVAVAALPAVWVASPASAQYQNGQSGHALDANTQAGSGGQNTAGPNAGVAVTGNQIVTGNVTGGRSFQGRLGYFDPNQFAGPLATQGTDRFIRDSSGVPSSYAPAYSPNTPRAFYSINSLATAPPPATVQENFQGVVVGTGLEPQNNTTSLASPLDYYRSQNLGGTVVYGLAPGTLTNSVSTLPPPGTEDNALATANPLITTSLTANSQFNNDTGEALPFSVAQPMLPGAADRFGLSSNSTEQLNNPYQNLNTNNAQPSITNKGNQPAQPGYAGNGTTSANPNGVSSARNQMVSQPLNNTLNPLQNTNNQNNQNNQNSDNPLSPLAPQSMLNQQPMNTPLTPYNQSPQLGTGQIAGTTFDNSLATNQSSRQWLRVPAAQQSTQYRELEQRLQEFNSSHSLTDQQASQQFQQQRLATIKAGGGAGGGGPAGGGAGNPGIQGPAPSGGGVNPGPMNPSGAPAASGGGIRPGSNPIKPSDLVSMPLHVTSLAEGVKNPELKGLLSSAEDLMKQDKFASATEKYDAAIQLTNGNNPLVLLGRANAELGAEFYGRAEADLRRAVAQDSALLMGQYDLTKMMDPKRLDTVRTDLESLANAATSVRPALLLAYLEYNTGNEAEAGNYLNQAEKLVGNSDPVIELMRTHWTFQSPQVKPGMDNKE